MLFIVLKENSKLLELCEAGAADAALAEQADLLTAAAEETMGIVFL